MQYASILESLTVENQLCLCSLHKRLSFANTANTKKKSKMNIHWCVNIYFELQYCAKYLYCSEKSFNRFILDITVSSERVTSEKIKGWTGNAPMWNGSTFSVIQIGSGLYSLVKRSLTVWGTHSSSTLFSWSIYTYMQWQFGWGATGNGPI